MIKIDLHIMMKYDRNQLWYYLLTFLIIIVIFSVNAIFAWIFFGEQKMCYNIDRVGPSFCFFLFDRYFLVYYLFFKSNIALLNIYLYMDFGKCVTGTFLNVCLNELSVTQLVLFLKLKIRDRHLCNWQLHSVINYVVTVWNYISDSNCQAKV